MRPLQKLVGGGSALVALACERAGTAAGLGNSIAADLALVWRANVSALLAIGGLDLALLGMANVLALLLVLWSGTPLSCIVPEDYNRPKATMCYETIGQRP
jgi:hypothetical protein